MSSRGKGARGKKKEKDVGVGVGVGVEVENGASKKRKTLPSPPPPLPPTSSNATVTTSDDVTKAPPAMPSPSSSSSSSPSSIIVLSNPHLEGLTEDCLYHLGLSHSPMKSLSAFSDVAFVCLSGSPDRAQAFALRVANELDISFPMGTALSHIGKDERYSLYKVGPVISVSHGMGLPSLSILLHEMAKLLHYAQASTPIPFIRMGTCGGVGVAPGTVIITTEAVNEECESFRTIYVCGKKSVRSTKMSANIVEGMKKQAEGWVPDLERERKEIEARERRQGRTGVVVSSEARDDGRRLPIAVGMTMSCEGFYEQQGRLDGAICDITAEEKMAWLHSLSKKGVKNIEMEGLELAAFCSRLSIPCCMLSTALVNRLESDQVKLSQSEVAGIASNAQRLALRYIKAQLQARKISK